VVLGIEKDGDYILDTTTLLTVEQRLSKETGGILKNGK
jgi:hypothetical protein